MRPFRCQSPVFMPHASGSKNSPVKMIKRLSKFCTILQKINYNTRVMRQLVPN